MAQPKGTAKTAETGPLLDLKTTHVVEYIKLDGKRHDLANLDRLPLSRRTVVSQLFTDVLRLVLAAADTSKPLSQKKEKQLTKKIKELVPMLVPSLEPADLKKLDPTQQQDIVMAFFVVRSEKSGGSAIGRMVQATEGMREQVEAQVKVNRKSTGRSTSPVSKGSTKRPARRTGGTKSRQGGSKPT